MQALWVQTPFKQTLIRHLERKKECETKNADTSREILLGELQTTITMKASTYRCDHCNRTFNNKSSKYRHLHVCKAKRKNDELERLKQEIEMLKSRMDLGGNTTINNNITNNNTVNNFNIVLREFNTETLDHLPKEFLTNCFMNKDIPMLIENIFFDKDCPENHNVRLKSLRYKMMQVFQDNKWVTKQSDDVLNQLVDKGSTILKKHYRKNTKDIEDDMTEEEINEVLDWLYGIVKDNDKIRKPIKDALLAMMDNYRSQLCTYDKH